jgi:hypothetical protein
MHYGHTTESLSRILQSAGVPACLDQVDATDRERELAVLRESIESHQDIAGSAVDAQTRLIHSLIAKRLTQEAARLEGDRS